MSTSPFIRLVLTGDIYSVQSWSMGCSFSCAATVTPADILTWLNAIVTPITTWWTATQGGGPMNQPSTRLTGHRAVFYPANAHTGGAVGTYLRATPLLGTGTAGAGVSQTALCYSLLTGIPGKRYRGRSYAPATAVQGATNGGMTAATAAAYATTFKTMLVSIAGVTLAGSGAAPVVATPTPLPGGIPDLPPRAITQVGVGLIYDTQRRRRNKLNDAKQVVSLP